MKFGYLTTALIPQVAAIERECMDEPWSENMLASELNDASSRVIVGVDGDRVICYGGFRRSADEADILNVAVVKDLRGKGIGKQLFERLIDEAKMCGVKKLTLEVEEQNAPAIALYSRFGFEKVGVRKRYYKNRFDALIMRLELEEGLDSKTV